MQVRLIEVSQSAIILHLVYMIHSRERMGSGLPTTWTLPCIAHYTGENDYDRLKDVLTKDYHIEPNDVQSSRYVTQTLKYISKED